jgi:hypothetical protein
MGLGIRYPEKQSYLRLRPKEGYMPGRVKNYAMGWVPDYHDFRDFTGGTIGIKLTLEQRGVLKAKSLVLSSDRIFQMRSLGTKPEERLPRIKTYLSKSR